MKNIKLIYALLLLCLFTSSAWAQSFTVPHVTVYNPVAGQGGGEDAHGQPIMGKTTMEDYCTGNGGYVTVAMDSQSPMQNQYLVSSQFPGVVFRVRDNEIKRNGVAGNSWMDIAYRNTAFSKAEPFSNITFNVISAGDAAAISANKTQEECLATVMASNYVPNAGSAGGGTDGSSNGGTDGAEGSGSYNGTLNSSGECMPNADTAALLGLNNSDGSAGPKGASGDTYDGSVGGCMAGIVSAAANHVGQGTADCKIAVAEVLGGMGYWSASQQQQGTNTYANNWAQLLPSNGFNCYSANSVSCDAINQNGGGVFVTQRAQGSGHVGIINSCTGDRLTTYEASIGSNAHQMRETSRSKGSVSGSAGGNICFPSSEACVQG